MNVALIKSYSPNAVISPGVTHAKKLAVLYGLQHVESIRTKSGHKLIEHYRLDGIDWVFTKHWTGARGFSLEQKIKIKEYLKLLPHRHRQKKVFICPKCRGAVNT